MRKLGYLLFILGFIWVTLVAVEVGPVARAMRVQHRKKILEQKSYSREDIETAYGEAVYGVAHFAQLSLAGCLLIFAGGIILGVSSRRNLTAGKPPIS